MGGGVRPALRNSKGECRAVLWRASVTGALQLEGGVKKSEKVRYLMLELPLEESFSVNKREFEKWTKFLIILSANDYPSIDSFPDHGGIVVRRNGAQIIRSSLVAVMKDQFKQSSLARDLIKIIK